MDTTALLPDDRPVTLTWTTTTTTEHILTVPYSELREALGRERDRYGRAHHPDLAPDLDLLEESWLGDYEEKGSLVEFTRSIQDHDLPDPPRLAVHTVTVRGSERHDGEGGYTYVLHAPDLDAARDLVLAHHIAGHGEDVDACTGGPREPDVVVAEGRWDTFTGAPAWPADLPGRAWTDLREDRDMLTRAYTLAGAR